MWIGPPQPGLDHSWHGREHQRVEPLHVAGAPPVEASVPLGQSEWIARPRLSVHRHDVGMAGEHDPAFDRSVRRWRRGSPWSRRGSEPCGFRRRGSRGSRG